jgi:hypothetical protein
MRMGRGVVEDEMEVLGPEYDLSRESLMTSLTQKSERSETALRATAPGHCAQLSFSFGPSPGHYDIGGTDILYINPRTSWNSYNWCVTVILNGYFSILPAHPPIVLWGTSCRSR